MENEVAYISPKPLVGKNTLLREFMQRARKKAGLSQEAIVARSQLISNQRMVARIEARPMKTKLKILMSYMEAVGISGDEFLMFYKRELKDA